MMFNIFKTNDEEKTVEQQTDVKFLGQATENGYGKFFEIYPHKVMHVNINDPHFPCGIRGYQAVGGSLRLSRYGDTAKNKTRRLASTTHTRKRQKDLPFPLHKLRHFSL